MIEEIWKPVVGYEGKYEISNLGNLKHLSYEHKIRSNHSIMVGENMVAKLISNAGYIRYHLSKNGKSKKMVAHRLVAIAFIPNPQNLLAVHHIDNNKTNNASSNLEWISFKDNSTRAAIDGKYERGEDRKISKLNNDAVINIRNEFSSGNFTKSYLSKKYKVSVGAISSVIFKKTWKHV